VRTPGNASNSTPSELKKTGRKKENSGIRKRRACHGVPNQGKKERDKPRRIDAGKKNNVKISGRTPA